ncbi:hypothetical protein ABIA54_004753 [Pseudomonas sp. EB276 TE3739]|nr:hypothetical protein [Pseudomonas koreensis]
MNIRPFLLTATLACSSFVGMAQANHQPNPIQCPTDTTYRST